MASINFETMRFCCVILCLGFLPPALWAQSQTVWLDYKKEVTQLEYAARYEEVLTQLDSVWQVLQYSLPERKLTARYAVLEAGSRFRHGTFLQYHPNGNLSDSGYYHQGYREGWHFTWHENGQLTSRCKYQNNLTVDTCTTWYPDGKMSGISICQKPGDGYRSELYPNQQVKAFGPLAHGKKYGRWKFLDENERPVMEVRFKDDWPQAATCYDTSGMPLQDSCAYHRDPAYAGGLSAWNQFLASHTQWPTGLKVPYAEPRVTIRFTIFEDGHIGNYEILESAHPLLTKEALRLLGLAGSWSPALYLNKPVAYPFIQVFQFRDPRPGK